ncbi:MAG: hypothetical protein JSR47_20610 [Proteobacteria bacterium]|nr:hypothetical protein [Pseudomonadota bacterium]
MNRRDALGLLGSAPFLAHAAQAQETYPSRPVRIVVPSGPAARATSSRASWRTRSMRKEVSVEIQKKLNAWIVEILHRCTSA